MSDVEVRRATRADRDRVVETFMAAFEADPALRYFFPGEEYAANGRAFAGWLFDDGASIALWDGPTGPDRVAPALTLPDGPRSRLDAYDAAVHHRLPTAA